MREKRGESNIPYRVGLGLPSQSKPGSTGARDAGEAQKGSDVQGGEVELLTTEARGGSDRPD